jgi:hypothetical protein
MSPEQIRGEDLDGRSDIFSLGVVFYELLSRTRPFGGDTISTLVFEILAKEPMPIESLRPGLPPALIQLLRSMMVKDRQQRVADAGKVVEAIQALEREIPAADLDRPASQAPNPDAQPTQLMGSQGAIGSGGLAAATSPYPSGPQTPLPFASSNPTGVPLAGVPMGAPLPSGPLAALPASAFAPSSGASPQGSQGYGPAPSYGAPQAGPPTPPPAPSWNAPPPAPSWNAPPPPSMTPPPMAQTPGAQPPQPPQAPPGYPPQGGYPPPGGYPPQGQHPQHHQHHQHPQHQQHQQAYGQPARPPYPTAKPTSPLKLILLLVFFGGFGLVGAFVLYVLFGDSGETAKPATASSPTVQEAPPPPENGAQDLTYGSGSVVIGENEVPDEEAAPAEANDGTAPTWTEPQPTTVTTQTPTPPPVDPAPTQTRPRTPANQSGDGGALGRLGDAIRTGDGSGEGEAETEADGGESDGGDYEPPAPRRPRQEPEEVAAWDQKAAGAKSVMDTGLRFQFKVTPPEAKVLFWLRGDARAVVQGSAGDFDPKKDEEARVLELPGDGDYLLMLRHGDFPDYLIKVSADRSRGKQPRLLQLNLGRGGGATTGTVRVSKAISFAGTPGDAYVFVDGRAAGRASDYPGGERRSGQNLRLDRGKHVVRLEAPGYKPYEFRVEVAGGAPALEQVNFRLEKE